MIDEREEEKAGRPTNSFHEFDLLRSFIHKSIDFIQNQLIYSFIHSLSFQRPATPSKSKRKVYFSLLIVDWLAAAGLTALIPQLKIKIIFILNWNGSLRPINSINFQLIFID